MSPERYGMMWRFLKNLLSGNDMDKAQLIAHYDNKPAILESVMEEINWPKSDYNLLGWYYNHLGMNRFLTVWQDQSFENEKRPPRSKYRTFRARLSRALGTRKAA